LDGLGGLAFPSWVYCGDGRRASSVALLSGLARVSKMLGTSFGRSVVTPRTHVTSMKNIVKKGKEEFGSTTKIRSTTRDNTSDAQMIFFCCALFILRNPNLNHAFGNTNQIN